MEQASGTVSKAAWFAMADRVKAKAAALLAVAPEDLAFTQDASGGLNLVAAARRLQPGDGIIVAPAFEHPNNIVPWLWQSETAGAELIRVAPESGEDLEDRIIAAMARGDVDAAAIFEPSASVILAQQGATMISSLARESFGPSHGGMYIRDAFVAQHPAATEAIVAATVKAIDVVKANKEAYIQRTMQVTGQTREIATLAVENVSPSWMMPMNTIRAICKAVHELGLEDRDVSPIIRNRVNYSFLEKITGKPKAELGHAA